MYLLMRMDGFFCYVVVCFAVLWYDVRRYQAKERRE